MVNLTKGCCVNKKDEKEGGIDLSSNIDHKIQGKETLQTRSSRASKRITSESNIPNGQSEIYKNSSNESQINELALYLQVIPMEEIDISPKLDLLVIESLSLEKGSILKINACGLDISDRDAKDGCTYFGSLKFSNNQEIINDVIIQEAGFGERHFMIKFDSEQKNYFLKDRGEGTGTFIKIESSIQLMHGFIISFCDSHMVVTLKNNNILQLKFLDGPKTDQTFTFSKSDQPIKIGRMNDCDIKFEDTALSRYQCIIEPIEEGFIIKDGDGKKTSTNGTWLFVDEFFEIFNNLLFKAGQSLFQAKLIHPS